MRASSIGAFVLLAIILGIVFVGLRTRRSGKELASYLQESGFAPAPVPIAQPFTYTDMISNACYRGELRAGAPVKLMLARRRGTSVVINKVATAQFEDYIGLYLEPAAAAKIDDAWLQRWQPDLDARGAKPMRVVRTPEGGVLFNWRSDHDRSTVAARLAAVQKALP